MKYKPKIQNIIRMLIKNRFYFDLPLLERYEFIKDILKNISSRPPAAEVFPRERPVCQKRR